ncbi:MAG TPA: radical SAM protein [Armatimonadota bacterium]|jgi:radical SAM superfamily enzyme YgiQ (UPF0313 family)
MPNSTLGTFLAQTPLVVGGREVVACAYDEQVSGPIDLSKDPPHILAITALTTSARRAFELASEARDVVCDDGKPPLVIMGGVHATFLPRECGRHVDIVYRGRCDGNALAELLEFAAAERGTGRRHILGDQWTKRIRAGMTPKDWRLLYGERGRAEGEMDRPSIRWDWRNPRNYLLPWSIQTSVGCRFDCDFCSVYNQNGKRQRNLRYDTLHRELAALESGRRVVAFTDDNFLPDRRGAHARAVCDITRDLGVHWVTELTPTNLTPETIDLFAASGCRGLFFGVEDINGGYSKSLSALSLTDHVHRCQDRGIAVLGAFIFGAHEPVDPGIFERTVEFSERVGFDVAQFSINTPEPGAPAFLQAVEAGLITDWDWEKYDAEHPVRRFRGITQDQMYFGIRNAYRWFYSLPSISKRLFGHSSWRLLGARLSAPRLRSVLQMLGANAYLAGTARGWNNRANYAHFRQARLETPDPLVLEEFGLSPADLAASGDEAGRWQPATPSGLVLAGSAP